MPIAAPENTFRNVESHVIEIDLYIMKLLGTRQLSPQNDYEIAANIELSGFSILCLLISQYTAVASDYDLHLN